MSAARRYVGATPGLVLAVATLMAAAPPQARQAPTGPLDKPQPIASPIERVSPGQFRVGNIRIDTGKREITVNGVVNDARTLEFIAGTKGGFKNYESALELDTNAVNFNLALILLGLDPARAVVPKMHLDPTTPKGDPVEVWVEWEENGRRRLVRGEELVYNEETKKTIPEGPWVYTGSAFVARANRYLADVDGTLIGFVHSPSTIIENPAPLVGPYGANQINPALNLKPGTPVRVTVRALGPPPTK
jgi:hypothetical protein